MVKRKQKEGPQTCTSPELTRVFLDYLHMESGMESAQRNLGRAKKRLHEVARAMGFDGSHTVRWDEGKQEAIVERVEVTVE